ncbi:type I polyketide synthase [Luedemannella helvata]|uniref:Type I polyketide synthase n=1 Tax=Luedemannella helvata TaxID=349315 RepID=A0ABP4X3T4_9ACTN
MTAIAIVGMACRYPDADSPQQLWENVLAGRRAFRRLPDVRMRLADYWDPDPASPDRFYARMAAVIEGYEFDRVGYRIAGSTYRSTDLSHWLALDVAAQALADAGFPMAAGLPRQRTGVVVGNTLTGEFTRANTMRLRWPYVRRTLIAALRGEGWADDKLAGFLDTVEARYKQPFPGIDEDTLAGGLSNTIAGRICNYFDLGGGGYAVDGACSSSLLSVISACRALSDGELDVAVAGGVDLSIDPFEMIGFAKTGALATGEMRVYDRNCNGFWPGEGAGMVVLMREADARAQDRRVYASVAGWGISSDGNGGITRPTLGGYQLALDRAYGRAGFPIEAVSLFEGHGTGTAVGDENELRALSSRRTASDPPAAIGSIKAMIGHTKAAAGVAGLIKAALAVHERILPPTVGCVDPHPVLTERNPSLRVLAGAEAWPAGRPVRAGVTAMGFGGINSHVVLAGEALAAEPARVGRARAITASRQDAEVLLLDAGTVDELTTKVEQLARFVPVLSYAQLTDLAVTLHGELADRPWRAAVVVDSADAAEAALRHALDCLAGGTRAVLDPRRRVFIGRAGEVAPRIGLLFPGQGSGRGTDGGALRRRFPQVEAVYRDAALPRVDPRGSDGIATAVAQPRIVAGSLAGLAVLRILGLSADVAVGHSLGELSALHWAGAMDATTLLRVARIRGETMSEHSSPGAMAGVGLPAERVEGFLLGEPVVVAGFNGPRQTVVAGPVEAIQRVGARVAGTGEAWAMLPVSHAFHSPLVAPSADRLAARLRAADVTFAPLTRRVVSTVTGADLDGDTDVVGLLRRQITMPVRFAQALTAAAAQVDLLIEVGPGRVLTRMVPDVTDVPALAMETDSGSLADLLAVAAATYVLGAPVRLGALVDGRVSRPLRVGTEFRFFASPCESVEPVADVVATTTSGTASPAVSGPVPVAADPDTDLLAHLRQLVAERAELPYESVREDSRLLDDLHLSSITVGHIVDEAARQVGLAGLQAPTNFATATLRELADAMAQLAETARTGGGTDVAAVPVAGAADWVRAFTVDLVEVAPPPSVTVAADGDDAWQVLTPQHPFAEPIAGALRRSGLGPGQLACFPDGGTADDLLPVFAAAQAAVAAGQGRFVLVQHEAGAAALARTLRLEAPHVRTTVLRVPTPAGIDGPSLDALVRACVAEVAATTGFTEAHYDRAGRRRVPTLRALPAPVGGPDAVAAFTEGDVLLVTGGGKGITAECALGLTEGTGAAVAVLGRSSPDADRELMANLTRMRDRGLRVHYVRADVTDPAAVRAAVAEIRDVLGPVTAVLHGAARNEPAALANLDEGAVRGALAPKVDGLDVVLAAVDRGELRSLITFGSVIGRFGLHGEAHYAVANDWLAARTQAYADEHPGCRCLCVEWSVWSGVGMGERLAVVESLLRQGIVPVTPDRGVEMLRALLVDPPPSTVVVVSGRAGDLETVRIERPELPLLRFLERTLVYYPRVELVTEVDLAADTDPYLADHELDNTILFPAVLGLEAMAQVALACLDPTGPARVAFENVEFARPIVVPKGGRTTIRIAATVTAPDRVAVAVRTVETGYAADHFTATVSTSAPVDAEPDPAPPSAGLPPVRLDPLTELYGGVLFQGKLFQRLLRYRRAAARDVDADLAVVDRAGWFSPFLPGDLLLGDPGVRDALLHGNQVCVPGAILLPVGVGRIEPAGDRLEGEVEVAYTATEREQRGDIYVYDVTVRAATGEVIERWHGLRLRAVRSGAGRQAWPAPLLGPHLERSVGARTGLAIAVTVEPDAGADRRAATALAIGRALGAPTTVAYRPDGRPEVTGHQVSAAHCAGLTLAVARRGTRTVSCDLELVRGTNPAEILGAGALPGGAAALVEAITGATGESPSSAGTRVWCAVECLRKAGIAAGPLVLATAAADGWVLLRSGDLMVSTFVATVHDVAHPLVFAILGQEEG